MSALDTVTGSFIKPPVIPPLSGLSSMVPIPNLTGGEGGDAGPASVKADAMFDSSGWNVNFGAGGIESSASKAATGLGSYLPFVLIAAGLIAFKLYRAK